MDSIKKLISLFSDFPTVGPRTAQRFVYYLTRLPKEKTTELTQAILELKSKIKFCSFCNNPFETDDKQNTLCDICSSHNRNKNLLCIVEKEQDLEKIEETKKYNGLYFIFGAPSSYYKNPEIENLKLETLRQRITKSNFQEIIIATNPTPEGISTSVLIERVLKETLRQSSGQVFKITHLARGIPIGGELEYADQETLESAFDGRK